MSFSLRRLADYLSPSMDDLTRQLGQLERIQLVRKLEGAELAYQFKHVLAQETTYQSMLVKKRRDIHLIVAQCYEQLNPEAPDSNAAILAYHYFEAGDPERTFHYALIAGDSAARLYAHAEALMFYDRALDMAHQLAGTPRETPSSRADIQRLYTNRGRVFELSNRYDLASKNYIEMEMEGRGQRNPNLELSGMTLRATLLSTYTSEFDPVQANKLNAQILARAREIGDRAAEAKIQWIMLLLAKYSEGNLDQAIEHGERALALARELGLRELVAYILNDISAPYSMTTRFEEARAGLAEAIKIWQELGNLAMLSDTIANLTQYEFYNGDLDGAERASTEALRLSRMTGSLWGQAYSQMWVGSLYAEQGDYGTALRVMEECLETARAANFLPPQVATRIDYAWLLGELGLVDQALAEAERASGLLQGIPPFSLFVVTVRLRLALLANDLETAEHFEEQVLHQMDSPFLRDPDGMARIVFARAELALAQKDYGRALETLEPAIEFFETHHIAPFLPEVLYLKGKAQYAQGNLQAALATLADAQHRAEALTSRRMLWQILALRAEIESALGNVQIAEKYREQTRQVVEYISQHVGSASRASSFRALSRVRALDT